MKLAFVISAHVCRNVLAVQIIHNAAAGLPGLLARFLHVSPGKGKE